MPVEFVNTFQPASDFGSQLSGVVRSLFGSKESPAERDARLALAADRQAQAGYHSALRRKAEAEAMGMEDRNRAFSGDMAGFAAAVAGVPISDVNDYVEWMYTGKEMPVQTVVNPDGSETVPGRLDSRRIADAIATYKLAQMTRPDNPRELSQTIGDLTERSRRDFVRNRPSMTGDDLADVARREAAIKGDPMFAAGAGGLVFDPFSGAAGPENPVSASTVAKNVATGLRNRFNESERGVVDTWQGTFTPHTGNVPGADVYTDMTVGGRRVPISRKDLSREAAQALFRAPTGTGAPDRWVEVEVNGRKVRVRESDMSRQAAEVLFPNPTNPRAENISGGELNQAAKTFSAALDQIEEDRGGKIPTEIRARIQARATELVKSPASPDTFRNQGAAFDQALSEIAPDWDREWNLFGPNVIRPKGGLPPRAAPPVAPKPAAPASPAAPVARNYVAPNGKAVPYSRIQETARARGVSEQQVITDLGLKPYD